MFKLLAVLVLAGIAAYYTKPERADMEAKARAVAEAPREGGEGPAGLIDEVVGYVKGVAAGDGRYEDFYLASKYSADLPGSDMVECYGAFTLVNCRVVEAGA